MQLLLNIVISGSLIVLVALSFALIYRTSRFLHFTHGILITVGAYAVFLNNHWFNLPMWLSTLVGVSIAVGLGFLLEFFVYRSFRIKHSSPLIMLLASLGLYVLLQNVVSLSFGDDTKVIRIGPIQEGISVLGARITAIQIYTIITCIVMSITLLIFLKTTNIGKAIKAVANDALLADVSGINVNRINLWVFSIGSGMAGLAGILIAFDIDMTPTMGMNILMMAVVAVIIGGVNNVSGIVIGGLLLSVAQQCGVWFLGAQWQDAIAFVILVIFLLFKPEGFFGKQSEKAFV